MQNDRMIAQLIGVRLVVSNHPRDHRYQIRDNQGIVVDLRTEMEGGLNRDPGVKEKRNRRKSAKRNEQTIILLHMIKIKIRTGITIIGIIEVEIIIKINRGSAGGPTPLFPRNETEIVKVTVEKIGVRNLMILLH